MDEAEGQVTAHLSTTDTFRQQIKALQEEMQKLQDHVLQNISSIRLTAGSIRVNREEDPRGGELTSVHEK